MKDCAMWQQQHLTCRAFCPAAVYQEIKEARPVRRQLQNLAVGNPEIIKAITFISFHNWHCQYIHYIYSWYRTYKCVCECVCECQMCDW